MGDSSQGGARKRSSVLFNDNVEVLEYSPQLPEYRRYSQTHLRGECAPCSCSPYEHHEDESGECAMNDAEEGFHGDDEGLRRSPPLDVDVPRKTHSRSHLDSLALERLQHTMPPGAHVLPLPSSRHPFNPRSEGYLPPNRTLALVSLRLRSTHPITHVHTIEGRVLVRNIAYEKRVFARFTLDAWATHRDEPAHFVQHYAAEGWAGGVRAGDPGTDAFEFTIVADPKGAGSSDTLIVHMKRMSKEHVHGSAWRGGGALIVPMQLAICFQCDRGEYWDNNDGANYTLSLTTI